MCLIHSSNLSCKVYIFSCFPSRSVIKYKYNVSVNNTTLYFIYNKNSILSGRHVSSSGPLGKQIQDLSIFQCIWDPTIHGYIDSSWIFSQRAWRWPNKGRNVSPWQYTIFVVCKIKCCVIDWNVVFISNIFVFSNFIQVFIRFFKILMYYSPADFSLWIRLKGK